jgi:hypothetical protein
MKKCTKCLVERTLENSWKGTTYCKTCYNAWKRENRVKNKEKISDRRKTQWKKNNARICKKCGESFVGKGRKRDYCTTKCKILHNIEINKKGCWEWKGDLHPNGYAYTTNHETEKKYHVHRVSYEIFKGRIPEGLYICHHCDNKSCCNPEHLWAGTAKENMQDAKRKGRLKNQHGRLPAFESDGFLDRSYPE